MESKVTVVIPTVGNFKMLKRALDSVLLQTYKNIEIIVVIDGKNKKTKDQIEGLKLNDIKVIETIKKVGGGAARNIGISNASGEWIALLDDDDEWLNQKIEIQIGNALEYSTDENYFSFTSLKTVGNGDSKILPRKKWKNKYNIDEYLFVPYFGRMGGYIQTSTIFASKKFFLKNKFDESLPKHQDWDWIINTGKNKNQKIQHINTPLTLYHQENINSVGKVNRWKFSKMWIESKTNLVSKKTIDFFFMIMVIPGIINDIEISKDDKYKEINTLLCNISLKNKVSLKYIFVLFEYMLLKVKR